MYETGRYLYRQICRQAKQTSEIDRQIVRQTGKCVRQTDTYLDGQADRQSQTNDDQIMREANETDGQTYRKINRQHARKQTKTLLYLPSRGH